MKTFQDFLHIMDFIGNQTVQGSNESFRLETMNFFFILKATLRI